MITYSIDEAAYQLGVSACTIRNKCRAGRLRLIDGRISQKDIDAEWERLKNTPIPEQAKAENHRGDLYAIFGGDRLGCLPATTGWPIRDETWGSPEAYYEQKRKSYEDYAGKCGPCTVRQMTEAERLAYGKSD